VDMLDMWRQNDDEAIWSFVGQSIVNPPAT
jgi:hypothetical protein